MGCCGSKPLIDDNNMFPNDITQNYNNLNEYFNNEDKLFTEGILGKGKFGIVYKVKNEKSNKEYASKQITLKNHKNFLSACREYEILSQCHHPNIISHKQTFKNHKTETINIITEFADDGTLLNKINQQKKGNNYFKENLLIIWLMQICLGLSYLDKKNIIHRDIKPENIFLKKNGLIKIGDFGLAKQYKSKEELKKKSTLAGTLKYMSPEKKKSRIYNEKSDIYSLGLTFSNLLVPNNNYSDEFKSLVFSLIKSDQENRPSSDEILKNSIIKKSMKNFLEENNYEKSLSYLIMKEIKNNNIYNEDEENIDDFINHIKEERNRLIKNEFNNEKKSDEDLDILMCIISKKIN